MNEQTGFGFHVTIDAAECDRNRLISQSMVYDLLNSFPAQLGMTKMTLPQVVKWLDPGATIEGISGFVMIAESHISIHTFPEKDYVFIDVFSCKPFDFEKAIEIMKEAFGAKKVTDHVIKRGLDFPRASDRHLYAIAETQ